MVCTRPTRPFSLWQLQIPHPPRPPLRSNLPSSLLLLSRAFTVTAPIGGPKKPVVGEDTLRDTLATLPDEVIEDVEVVATARWAVECEGVGASGSGVGAGWGDDRKQAGGGAAAEVAGAAWAAGLLGQACLGGASDPGMREAQPHLPVRPAARRPGWHARMLPQPAPMPPPPPRLPTAAPT